jgi:predicted nucleic acid-binding protein
MADQQQPKQQTDPSLSLSTTTPSLTLVETMQLVTELTASVNRVTKKYGLTWRDVRALAAHVRAFGLEL